MDDGFGDRTPACRDYTHPRADSGSTLFAAIRDGTSTGPVLQVHVMKFLGKYGIEIQIPSTTSRTRTSWAVICRGQNRFVEELRHLEPGPNPTSKELLREREQLQKKNEPSATELNQSHIEETHATQELVPADPVHSVKKTIPMGERKWIDIPANKFHREDAFSDEIFKIGHETGTSF